ncbi:histidine kinase [Streptomyces sp. LRE541]|uniref:sensor histidine kinase n=1 Tax=Streptomyces sp. LRE541 TaxID=2931983 RepID=UPI00200FF883|nr:histidine kinase [Streptomyces sp. LRE541]UPZ27268.1 histidine kinase [Streptomyces sp. LRE541]
MCSLAVRNYGLWAVAPATVVAIVATYLAPRARRTLILGSVLLALLPGAVVSLAAEDGEVVYAALFPAGLVAFTVWVMLGPLWAWDTARRLDEARRLEAELAVRDERLKFAANLHDIQGHHLQVISLKSELAARVVDTDPARAAAEMREVRQLAADALSDTRAVVQGYRRTTLDDEITNATRVLAAAGIDARTTLAQATAVPAAHAVISQPAGGRTPGFAPAPGRRVSRRVRSTALATTPTASAAAAGPRAQRETSSSRIHSPTKRS